MGYYVRTEEVNAMIEKENFDAAYKAMCELNAIEDGLKNGGSSREEEKPADSKSLSNNPSKWFSWMLWNYDEVFTTAKEILEELGFEMEEDEVGNLLFFDYDSKSGQEEMFLEAIAPFITGTNGGTGYIAWCGEGTDRWVNIFKNGEMETYEQNSLWFASKL